MRWQRQVAILSATWKALRTTMWTRQRQVLYRPIEPQGESKDYEFSQSSMEMRWQQGLSDARVALQASPWLAPIQKEVGVGVFDLP
jgi:hypothetical protein